MLINRQTGDLHKKEIGTILAITAAPEQVITKVFRLFTRTALKNIRKLRKILFEYTALIANQPEYSATNKDRSANLEYCSYCNKYATFAQDCTMDETIEPYIPFLEDNRTPSSKKQAIAEMKKYFTALRHRVITNE